jgi:hypothetical protein
MSTTIASPTQLPPLSVEFASVDFGDQRLSLRLWRIVEALSERPAVAFPEAMGDGAGLEGLYRFIHNERVTPAGILRPHVAETCPRAAALATILAVHDTTEVEYEGEVVRDGLGPISGAGQGYFAHVALAVSADGFRQPLGVLGLRTHTRDWPVPGAPKKKRANKTHASPDSESRRWHELVDEVETLAQGRFKPIHVMDREGDAFALLADLAGHGRSFVVRAQHDREVIPEDSDAIQRLHQTPVHTLPVIEREVVLSRRSKKGAPPASRRKHPPREARMAQLIISAMKLEVVATTFAGRHVPQTIPLHCVHVCEVEAPEGVEPVEWWLWTQLPVDTPEQILYIVDVYRARWVIEEYFKALKTGCSLEKRQQESADSLLNVLALLMPVAWRLLLLRHIARHQPDAPASAVLTPTQIDVLAALRATRWPLLPTARDALLAVAALGGHLRHNGEPGWLVLGRGYENLLRFELGWCLARKKM